MALDQTNQLVLRSCYAFFVLLFLIWFFYALGNYMTASVSSSVSLKFGDSGDNFVVFPVLTFCKALELKTGLWRGITETCKGEELIKLQPPWFMNYVKECLEVNPDLQVEDIIGQLTYDVDEVINNVIFMNPEFPDDVEFFTPMVGGTGPNWRTVKDKILTSHFDLHFGHCYNLDFAPLSPYGNGKFLINKGVIFVHTRTSINVYPKLKPIKGIKKSSKGGPPKGNLTVPENPEDGFFGSASNCKDCETIPWAIFVNNGTDIDRLGGNIIQRDLKVGMNNLKIKKTIIDSLPTTAQKCSSYIYATCVKETIGQELIQDYGCSLPFLPGYDKVRKMCGREVTIATITKIFDATQSSDYKDCHNVQPCKSVVYSFSNPEFKELPPRFTDAKVYVTFESTMVENIVDSYDYNSISIFSEIGGSVGVLTGISCITVVELFLRIIKKSIELYKNKDRVTPVRAIMVKEKQKAPLPDMVNYY